MPAVVVLMRPKHGRSSASDAAVVTAAFLAEELRAIFTANGFEREAGFIKNPDNVNSLLLQLRRNGFIGDDGRAVRTAETVHVAHVGLQRPEIRRLFERFPSYLRAQASAPAATSVGAGARRAREGGDDAGPAAARGATR